MFIKRSFIILLILFFWSMNFVFWACSYTAGATVTAGTLKDCVDPSGNNLVEWDMGVTWWFKTKISSWIDGLTWILWLFAVFAIVYGSFLLVIWIWEEEKIKKWKDVIKWWIIWFLWIVSAWALIRVVVGVLV